MTPATVRLPGDGVMLEGDAYGDPGAPPVLFFHGGGQSRRAWAGSARRVAEAGFYGISVDLRGHGGSEWAADGDYLLAAFGRDVAALIDRFPLPVTLVGASRGGQAAMVGAPQRPGAVRLVMLADVSPFLDDSGVDAVRAFFRASDAGFASVEAAADALHVHLGQPRVANPAGLARAMRRVDGRLFWHWDPRTTDPAFLHPPSEGETLQAAARALRCPVVLVRAEHSEIVSVKSVARFGALTPQLRVETAANAGHMFTADRNDAFAETLLRHLGPPTP
ncbi:alpha/beta fold hydrolase [Sphingomonas solaris]|uniref:Alpha/beta hydrolase n=1 Tax=Alterirhizorhabdus solaris TaxID=2529389 RepID=A0A558RCP7_9SPHN|nr:alpha/beta fold hydrolase [Sphingomonas solaris]TVV77124.1 alpha/beta hydrolase [Sphingomonas solaris]